MLESLYWSDDKPLYYGITWALFAAVTALAVPAAFRKEVWNKSTALSSTGFLVLAALTMAASRWPGLFYPRAYSTDEAQAVTHAITLAYDPVFYRSVAGLTWGPLMIYPLAWPLAFGFVPSYFTARLAAVGAVSLALIGLYLIVRDREDEGAARLAVLPPLAFFAFTNFWDFLYFTSEHAPIAYLSLATLAVLRLREARQPLTAFAAGFFTACAPLAKIQATPAALYLGLAALVFIATKASGERSIRQAAWLLAGAATPFILLAATWLVAGVFGTFWQTYILDSLSYVKVGTSLPASLIGLFRQIDETGSLNYYLIPIALCVVTGGLLLPHLSRNADWPARGTFLPFALGLLLVSTYAVIAPGRMYYHYLLFLVWPSALCAAALLVTIRRALAGNPAGLRLASAAFLVVTLAPAVHFRVQHGNQFAGMARRFDAAGSGDPVVAWLQSHAAPGDRLVPWGWRPDYNAEAGLPQGTRILSTIPITEHHHGYEHFLPMIMADIERGQPEFFIDTVAPGAPWLKDRARHGHDSIPALAELIRRDYALAAEIDGVRIYRLRHERAAPPQP